MGIHVRDARRLSPQAQEDLRRRVVAAVEAGMTQVEAARVFQVSATSVSGWVNAVRRQGERALTAGRRGRRPEEQKALSKAQQRTVCRSVVNQTPAQAGGTGLLWTRKEVANLVKRRFGIALSLPTTGKYLRRWGLSPQKPVRKSYEQNPATVREWLDERYPAIVAAAKAEGGIILWLDESGIASTAELRATWAPIGTTPVVPKTGRRFRVNLMAAISNRGALTFTVYEGSLTVARYTDFLHRLIGHYDTPVHLIVDGHPTHKAKTVKAWLAEHTGQITQYFLPGYSPELNPVEILNGDTKRHVAALSAPRNRAELTVSISSHLHRRQKQPAVVAALFGKDEVRYAAACEQDI
ncbi:IS630 family transposase [Actinocrinis puniceicyclus]|uniref:IS630 family transposase n=1 Tax=Actinocrinis puniceicyclus TaxID=977794 RepID=A0A8J7WQ09_9ACTN|nr:IS630 family transposase [Actinocrinis puniceicyclus]MBS2966416.1 IS630 family transposase [Actinocrinis puniceicyclus]